MESSRYILALLPQRSGETWQGGWFQAPFRVSIIDCWIDTPGAIAWLDAHVGEVGLPE